MARLLAVITTRGLESEDVSAALRREVAFLRNGGV
jgi:hypothetical protein